MIIFSLSGFSQTKIKPSQISNATKQSFKEVLDINKLETSLDSTNTVLSTKIDSSGISSSLDEFYNKTQSNARFINEDGDTITGIIHVPTADAGTNTTLTILKIESKIINPTLSIIRNVKQLFIMLN